VEGANLSMGDMHFSQGDGEVSFCGAIEMSGFLHLRCAAHRLDAAARLPPPMPPLPTAALLLSSLPPPPRSRRPFADAAFGRCSAPASSQPSLRPLKNENTQDGDHTRRYGAVPDAHGPHQAAC